MDVPIIRKIHIAAIFEAEVNSPSVYRDRDAEGHTNNGVQECSMGDDEIPFFSKVDQGLDCGKRLLESRTS